MFSLEIQRKFWDRVRFWGAGDDDCWIYMKGATGGYALLLWKELGDRAKYAHRFSYELINGEIPDGYVIDHECHNRDPHCPSGKKCIHRRCCNPKHLVAKTLGQNVKAAHDGRRETKTHCAHGHPWNEKNTRILSNGWRQCRTCAKEKTALRRATEGRRHYE